MGKYTVDQKKLQAISLLANTNDENQVDDILKILEKNSIVLNCPGTTYKRIAHLGNQYDNQDGA